MTRDGAIAVALAIGILSKTALARAAPAGGDESGATATEETRDPRASERARTTFDQAREAFARKSYVAAASAFEQSESYVPHPGPWVNAAEAWILAGDPVRAARACDRALAFADIDEATRAQA
ncbi:MAG: hypothetical protein JWM74_6224, partial [Myxococcaceae bacterium]|nr:hypothetical protein [Myxococcaceae bacterium]